MITAWTETYMKFAQGEKHTYNCWAQNSPKGASLLKPQQGKSGRQALEPNNKKRITSFEDGACVEENLLAAPKHSNWPDDGSFGLDSVRCQL